VTRSLHPPATERSVSQLNVRVTNLERVLRRMGEAGGGGRPYADIVVAASNSTATDKDNADFVCDGTGDQAEINAAVNAARGAGSPLPRGKVVLLGGDFYISGSISDLFQVHLGGMGWAHTRIHEAAAGTSADYWENHHVFDGDRLLEGSSLFVCSDLMVESFSRPTIGLGTENVARDCYFNRRNPSGVFGAAAADFPNVNGGGGAVRITGCFLDGGTVSGAGGWIIESCRTNGATVYFDGGAGGWVWTSNNFESNVQAVRISGGGHTITGNKMRCVEIAASDAVLVGNEIRAGSFPSGGSGALKVVGWSGIVAANLLDGNAIIDGSYNVVSSNKVDGNLTINGDNNVGGVNRVGGSVTDNGTSNTGF
jgi:hypothetical protein